MPSRWWGLLPRWLKAAAQAEAIIDASTIDPDPIEGCCDTARQGDHGALAAQALRKLGPPVFSHVDDRGSLRPKLPGTAPLLGWASPVLVMPPETSRSPHWLRTGISPTQGPRPFEERKRAGHPRSNGRSAHDRTGPRRRLDRPGRARAPAFPGQRPAGEARPWRRESPVRCTGPVAAYGVVSPSASFQFSDATLEPAPRDRPDRVSVHSDALSRKPGNRRRRVAFCCRKTARPPVRLCGVRPPGRDDDGRVRHGPP